MAEADKNTDEDVKDPDEAEGADGVDGEESETPKKRRFSGKFIVLFVVLPLLVLGGGGYLAASMFGFLGGDAEMTADKKAPPKKALYYDLPEMLVNLSSVDRQSRFLKLKVSLEMTDEAAKAKLPPVIPRVLDMFQVYLRELRADDLAGSAGVYRLKEELVRRINLSIRPQKIDRVLFRQMLIQ